MLFTPVRMKKLFAAVLKDHAGKVISALGDTGSCHFIEQDVPGQEITAKKNLLLSIERYIDEVLFRIPGSAEVMIDINVSTDADLMLYDMARAVTKKEKPARRQLMEIRRRTVYLRSVYSVLEHCRETRYTYILEAWVPEGSQDIVKAAINDASSDQCEVYFSEPEFGETPPTLLSNPGMMKVFENLVKRYGLPSYYEMDPTWLIFLTFPFIFGMMYGDVGHGIVLLLVSMGIFLSGKKRFKRFIKFKELSPILIMCSVFSVIFGLLYGEFFGLKFEPLWLSPSENISYFLVLSVWAGVLHMVLGFILNAINLWKNKKYQRSIFQAQWIIFSVSSILFFTRYPGSDLFFHGLLVLILLPGISMVLSGILINSVEGMGGLSGIMVPFYLGVKYAMQLMSYMRVLIMALAHSTISATIIALSGKSVFSIIIAGIITFVLIIIVETFIVFIQTLRLHWVEWFYLFYKGRGREFTPFRRML